MRQIFTILGVISAVIIFIFILAAAIFIPRTLELDREATAYIQDAIPKIVTNWSSQELVDRATPELLAAGQSRGQIDRLFTMFRELGSFQHLDKPEGAVVSSAFSNSGVVTLGNYVVQAEFEKGTASIQIQLRRVDGTWKINGFHINSDVFFPTK
jgi:hypothetical protein